MNAVIVRRGIRSWRAWEGASDTWAEIARVLGTAPCRARSETRRLIYLGGGRTIPVIYRRRTA